MTASTLSQALSPATSIFSTAMELETAAGHLNAMLATASHTLSNCGAGQDPGDMLADTGLALSMLDAAGKYLSTIVSLNDRLYSQAQVTGRAAAAR